MVPHGVLSLLLALSASCALRGAAGAGRKCYVCIPNSGSSVAEVTRMFPSGPSLPLCNQFQEGNKEFIRECPSALHLGCMTQTNGTHVTKTCSNIAVDDCKTANLIKYCYCRGELCNKEAVPKETARPPITPDDDEDGAMEGSGGGSAGRSREDHDRTDKAPQQPEGEDIGLEETERPAATTAGPRPLTTASPAEAASAASAPAFLPSLLLLLSIDFYLFRVFVATRV